MKRLALILRSLLGAQPKRCPLSELFKTEPHVESAIVLEETGLPYGGVTTYTWWRSNRFGYYRKTHKSFGSTEPHLASVVVLDAAERVDILFSLVEEYGALRHYSGSTRDGVIYRLSWGTKDHRQTLTAKNPPSDSRHHQLVAQIKESVWT